MAKPEDLLQSFFEGKEKKKKERRKEARQELLTTALLQKSGVDITPGEVGETITKRAQALREPTLLEKIGGSIGEGVSGLFGPKKKKKKPEEE